MKLLVLRDKRAETNRCRMYNTHTSISPYNTSIYLRKTHQRPISKRSFAFDLAFNPVNEKCPLDYSQDLKYHHAGDANTL